MADRDIVVELTCRIGAGTMPIAIISMHDIIVEVAKCFGASSLDMTTADFEAIQNEVVAIIDHDFDYRDFVLPAIEIWRISKNMTGKESSC